MKHEKRLVHLSANARDRMRRAMDLREMTQVELSQESGVSQARVSGLLSGRARGSAAEIQDIFRVLRLDTAGQEPWVSRSEAGQKRAVVGLVIDWLEECLPALPLPDLYEWGKMNALVLGGQFGALTERQARMIYELRNLNTHMLQVARPPAVTEKEPAHDTTATPHDM